MVLIDKETAARAGGCGNGRRYRGGETENERQPVEKRLRENGKRRTRARTETDVSRDRVLSR